MFEVKDLSIMLLLEFDTVCSMNYNNVFDRKVGRGIYYMLLQRKEGADSNANSIF